MEYQDYQHIAVNIRPKLVELCRRFFNSQELAYNEEDAVQETLLRLWKMRDRWKTYDNPESLAVLIAKNVCIDFLRGTGNHHELLDDNIKLYERAQADQQLLTNETEKRIAYALNSLSDTQRRMIVMRGEGMSMAEIASACGTTAASTKTMICTARKKLLLILKEGREML